MRPGTELAVPSDDAPWVPSRNASVQLVLREAMRVLVRKFGEIVRIGSGVTVRVLETTCRQARIAVEAPPGIRVIREEIYRAILRENQKAALSGPEALVAAASLVPDYSRASRGSGSKMVH